MSIETGPTEATPEALLAAWRRERDPQALGALFDIAAPGLFRLALSLCSDAGGAEDALQDTFLFALESADRWDPSRPALPWLAGILRNKVREVRRRDSRTPRPERVTRPSPPDDPFAAAAGAEEVRRVREALRDLPDPYREAAILRWRYGLEPAEIAEVKGVPPGTVASWLHRARERMRVDMGVLPALFAGVFPGRGLDAVREEVMRGAAARATATGAGSGAAAALAAGGVLMTVKVQVAAACALVLGATLWLTLRPGAPSPSPAPEAAVGKIETPSSQTAQAVLPSRAPPATRPPSSLEAPPPPSAPDRTTAGRVLVRVRSPEGEPVPGVQVQLVARGGPRSVRESGTEGEVEFTWSNGEVVIIRAIPAEPYLDPGPTECTVGGFPVEIRLERGAAIRGQVLGPDGRPLEGMTVRAEGPLGSWEYGRTGSDGEFALFRKAGVPVRLDVPGFQARRDGSGASIRTNLRAAPREVYAPVDGVVFTMHAIRSGMSLTVRVVDLVGNPIPGCSVLAPNGDEATFPMTGPDGSVTIESLFEEPTRILAMQPSGRAGGPATIPEGTVMPDPVTVVPSDQEIVLRLRAGEPRKGRVLDAEERTVSGAWVTLQTDDYVAGESWSDAQGKFTVHVSPGRRLIRATAVVVSPEGPRFTADLGKDEVPQEGEIVLRLAPADRNR
jgi:RNA polymerase sigma-70 factor (ECF subfamily)